MLRILHVGCGSISNSWLSNLTAREDLEICGIVDINRSAAEEQARKYNLSCPVFTNTETALLQIKPDILIDNIIPAGRLELAELAMSSGAHVLSEKPLADSIENALKIIQMSEIYNKNFFVMQNRRYNTNMFSFKNVIQSGIIGTPGYISAEFFRDPHFGGFRDEMDSPLLVDMAIHTFDQARFLLGKNPVSVYCREYNPEWSWYKGKSSAVCIFTFEDDVIFNYTGSWSALGMKTSWDSNWRVAGSKGSCTWNGTDFPKAEGSVAQDKDRYHPNSTPIDIEKINCPANSHKGCINEMISSIIRGEKAQTDCRDNILSLAMVFAAVKSAKENREILIKEILEV